MNLIIIALLRKSSLVWTLSTDAKLRFGLSRFRDYGRSYCQIYQLLGCSGLKLSKIYDGLCALKHITDISQYGVIRRLGRVGQAILCHH